MKARPAPRQTVIYPGGDEDAQLVQAMAVADSQPWTFSLQPQDYKFTRPIELRTGQRLEGNGARVTSLVSASVASLNIGQDCVVRDVYFTSQGVGIGMMVNPNGCRWYCEGVRMEGFNIGLVMDYCWIGTFRDCLFRLNKETGVRIKGSLVNDVRFIGGGIEANQEGIVVTGQKHMGLTFNTCIEGNPGGGVNLAATVNARFEQCYFEQNGPTAIYHGGTTYGTVIRDNCFVNEQLGIRIARGWDIMIEGNSFQQCRKAWLIEQSAMHTVVNYNNYMHSSGVTTFNEIGDNNQRFPHSYKLGTQVEQTYVPPEPH